MSINVCAQRLSGWLLTIAIFLASPATLAQNQVKAPRNYLGLETDVEAGRHAAFQAESRLLILYDSEVNDYVGRIGRRLVAAIPREFRRPTFRYSFKVVNARDVNAFALPGGFTYLTRGLIETVRTDGELAGVIAHELSHVVLRHGTAPASKVYVARLITLMGSREPLNEIEREVIGLGLNVTFLKFNRDYEEQADLLGAQIMARAGYDPRNLVEMFRTIEREGSGRGGRQWLSRHPAFDNRYERINQEAALLGVASNPIQERAEFNRIQSRLRGLPPTPLMGEIIGNWQRYPQDNWSQGLVKPPSSRLRIYTGGDLFRVSVPDNWYELQNPQCHPPCNRHRLPGNSGVTFAPWGGYGNVGGHNTFTHGVYIGVERSQGGDLRETTDQFINTLMRGNPHLSHRNSYRRGYISGRDSLGITLTGKSDMTQRVEIISVHTSLLRNGGLFYMITVAPQDDYQFYYGVFLNTLNSIQITN
jgi:beta-barrel assembly-enhancing protease